MKEILKTEAQKDSANFVLQMIVAVVILVLAVTTLVVMVAFHGQVKDNTNFSMWLGAVIGWIGILLAFCFPNSIGAQKDKDTIARLAGSAATPGVTIEPPVTVTPAGSGPPPDPAAGAIAVEPVAPWERGQ